MIDPPPSLPAPPSIPPPITRRHILTLVCILAVGGGLRFYHIARPSLWMDEIMSVELAMGNRTAHDFFSDGIIRQDQPNLTNLMAAAPWWHIWNHLQITTHPPIYFVVLRWWMDFFGTAPAAARSLSAIFSLAGILIFFDICRFFNSPRIALLAAALMTFSIGQIDIAREARSYPLLIFLGLACCDLIVRIQFRGATLYCLAVLWLVLSATILTHYFSAGALAGLAIYSLIRLRGRDRRRTLLAFLAAGIFAVVVWGPQFLFQLHSAPPLRPSYLVEVFPNHVTQTFLRLARLPLQFFCGDDLSQKILLPIHLAVAFLVLVLPLFRLRQSPDRLLWMLWSWGIILSVAMLDLSRDSTLLYYTRYTILASPALFAILAGFRWPTHAGIPAVGAIALVAAILCDGLRLHTDVPPKQDFKSLAALIDDHTLPSELLVFYNNRIWVSPGLWYLCYKYYSPDSNHPWLTLRHPPDPALSQELVRRAPIWLIGLAPRLEGPALLPGWHVKTFWMTSAGGLCLMEPGQSPVR